MTWSGHPNGQIPKNLMVEVFPGQYLEPHAAADFIAWDAAVHKTTGHLLTVDQLYRPLGAKTDKPTNTPTSSQWAVRNYANAHPEQRLVTADPGHSPHGDAQAADIGGLFTTNADFRKTALELGKKYGWLWGSVPSESWHTLHADLKLHMKLGAHQVQVKSPGTTFYAIAKSHKLGDDGPHRLKILNPRIPQASTPIPAGFVINLA